MCGWPSPVLLLAIIIVARLGPSLHNAVIALGIIGAPAFYRLMRCGALGLRRTDYVAAARATGANDRRIMARHVFPNLASSIIVLLTLRMGILILAGGSLSFHRAGRAAARRRNGALCWPGGGITWTWRPGWRLRRGCASPSPWPG
jgi:peptide/nickel transport system permease protein